MIEVQTVMEEYQNKEYDYAPDGWFLIKITGDDPHYRVFGSWRGGYLNGDSWRMNSGITRVEIIGDYYFFHGNSGSIYRCYGPSYGHLGSYGHGVLNHLESQRKEIFHVIPFLPDNIAENINN